MTWRKDRANSPVNYCEVDRCGNIGDKYSNFNNPPDNVSVSAIDCVSLLW